MRRQISSATRRLVEGNFAIGIAADQGAGVMGFEEMGGYAGLILKKELFLVGSNARGFGRFGRIVCIAEESCRAFGLVITEVIFSRDFW